MRVSPLGDGVARRARCQPAANHAREVPCSLGRLLCPWSAGGERSGRARLRRCARWAGPKDTCGGLNAPVASTPSCRTAPHRVECAWRARDSSRMRTGGACLPRIEAHTNISECRDGRYDARSLLPGLGLPRPERVDFEGTEPTVCRAVPTVIVRELVRVPIGLTYSQLWRECRQPVERRSSCKACA